VPSPEHSLYIPLALKLHAFGLSRLQDGEWCGENLWDNAKQHYRGRREPRWLFQQPVRDGFLLQLGGWLFEEYLDPSSGTFFAGRTVEFWFEYLEDYQQFLSRHGIPSSNPVLQQGDALLRELDELFGKDEDGFYSAAPTNRQAIRRQVERLRTAFSRKLEELKPSYAQDYAERVFHDRQLCGYIAELILEIGIDGTTDDEAPGQWCERVTFPTWVRDALLARERGKCAVCGTDLLGELLGVVHIDHIVPLSKGGCNDVVNLQILCETCNREKSSGAWPVTSSIPQYLKRALRRRDNQSQVK